MKNFIFALVMALVLVFVVGCDKEKKAPLVVLHAEPTYVPTCKRQLEPRKAIVPKRDEDWIIEQAELNDTEPDDIRHQLAVAEEEEAEEESVRMEEKREKAGYCRCDDCDNIVCRSSDGSEYYIETCEVGACNHDTGRCKGAIPPPSTVTIFDKTTGKVKRVKLDPPMSPQEIMENKKADEEAEQFREWNKQMFQEFPLHHKPQAQQARDTDFGCWCEGEYQQVCDEGPHKPHLTKHCANGCSGGECD